MEPKITLKEVLADGTRIYQVTEDITFAEYDRFAFIFKANILFGKNVQIIF